VKALFVLVAVCAALVAAAPSVAAGRVVERGIVQSVGPASVVLRALDGTDVTVPVGPATRIRLNGRPARLSAVRSGFVAEAVTVGDGPAVVIRAFGRAAQEAVVGELVRIRPHALVVLGDTGGRLRIAITRSTQARQGSARVALGALRPGMRVQVVRAPNGSARVVRVLGGVGPT
jgi:hypothetical protein